MSDLNNARNDCVSGNVDIIRTPITEAELHEKESIAPDDVLRLNCATEGFLCSIEENVYGTLIY
jgi:hypothetical protein